MVVLAAAYPDGPAVWATAPVLYMILSDGDILDWQQSMELPSLLCLDGDGVSNIGSVPADDAMHDGFSKCKPPGKVNGKIITPSV